MAFIACFAAEYRCIFPLGHGTAVCNAFPADVDCFGIGKLSSRRDDRFAFDSIYRNDISWFDHRCRAVARFRRLGSYDRANSFRFAICYQVAASAGTANGHSRRTGNIDRYDYSNSRPNRCRSNPCAGSAGRGIAANSRPDDSIGHATAKQHHADDTCTTCGRYVAATVHAAATVPNGSAVAPDTTTATATVCRIAPDTTSAGPKIDPTAGNYTS